MIQIWHAVLDEQTCDECRALDGAQIKDGEYIYYVVETDTNIRRSKDGVPIIFANDDMADYACNWTHEQVVSVAAYNRMYGRFMTTDVSR